MKFRFHGDSVRLRLSRSEVATLGSGKPVIAETRISTFLRFMVKVEAAAVPAITLRLDGLAVVVSIPAADAKTWAANEEEGLYHTQDNGDPMGGLKIAIEKDYACLHHDESHENNDTFPHPHEGR